MEKAACKVDNFRLRTKSTQTTKMNLALSRIRFRSRVLSWCIFVLLPWVANLHGTPEAKMVLPKSPDGNFIFSVAASRIGQTLTVSIGPETPGVTVCEIERWAEIRWAGDSKCFAIENHRDAHITNLSIFRIERSGGEGKSLHLEKVYDSPSPMQYDSHWRLLKFNAESGTAEIACRFRYSKDGFAGEGIWNERRFVVPISLLPLR